MSAPPEACLLYTSTSALRLKFPPSPRSGSYPVIMEGVGKTYGNHVVFRNANLTVDRGDKVAFVGKNGEGKSCLLYTSSCV